MSAEPHEEHDELEVRQAPDVLDRRSLMAVTVGSVIITGVALVVAWLLLDAWGQKPRTTPPPVAPRTIGTLEQTLVLDTKRGLALRAEQEASLGKWEWVDRDAGVARIPIAEAIDVLASDPIPADRPLSPPVSSKEAP
jgi:hypothetical protein